MKTNVLHSFILSNFSKTAAIEKICETAGIDMEEARFLQHPDVYQIKPEVNEKTVLKKPSIKIGQVRQLKADFSKRPRMLPVQIAVLWDAQYLTESASNSLLKLLEEPVNQSMIYLVADSYQHLLPTIQSRCEIVMSKDESQKTKVEILNIDLKHLYQSNVAERMELIASACPTQSDSLEWLRSLLLTCREKLPHSSARGMGSLGQLIENTQTLYNDISIYNVNYKLALDMLAMHWDKEISCK